MKEHHGGLTSGALPPELAERVLSRAGELDVNGGDLVPVSRLREAAEAAGISPEAFEAALVEVAGERRRVSTKVPRWVRVCLFGVTDRRVAMTYYWLFVAALLSSPVVAAMLPSQMGLGERLAIPLLTAGWALFSLWSTSRAIRWADRNGWDALP
jgi:hypothetical protein